MLELYDITTLDRALSILENAEKTGQLKKGSLKNDPINFILFSEGIRFDYFKVLDKWIRGEGNEVKDKIKEIEKFISMENLYILEASWEGSFYDPYNRRTIDLNVSNSINRFKRVLKTIL